MKRTERVARLYRKLWPSQKAAAAGLKRCKVTGKPVSKQRFNQWFNGKHEAPLERILEMEAAIRGDTLPLLFDDHASLIVAAFKANRIRFAEVVREAIAHQEEGGERRGRVSKKGLKAEEKNRTGGFLEAIYSNKVTAELFGFSSEDTYCRAKKIVQSELVELIEAMESHVITVSEGVQLLALPQPQMFALLDQGKLAVKLFFKEEKHRVLAQKQANICLNDGPFLAKAWVWEAVCSQRENLYQAEKQSHEPVSLIHFGLADRCCDGNGEFLWDIVALESQLTVQGYFSLHKGLEVLCACGAVKKIQKNGVWYGQLTLNPHERR